MKQHAPATLRNREAILTILRKELPDSGTVLEVAAGSGEHAAFFAEHLPNIQWQPTDPSDEAIDSIAVYVEEAGLLNLSSPLELDASAPDWPVSQADAIVCINMVHISPWAASEGLFAGAAQILSGKNLPLILYGPYFEQGVETAPSNLEFDASLKARNPAWGIRHAEDLDSLAARHGFTRNARYEMPANNLMLVYR